MDKDIYSLREKILQWYRKNKRDLPWRRTQDPYEILVSEIMLQQTQVDRVIPKYESFLKHFPTIESLANAPLADVLKLWSGLGYNRRAKYLKETAKTVKDCYDSKIPNSYEELIKLPGIGDYTANAVLCFAFKQKRSAVDTNVRNVIEQELNDNKTFSIKQIKEFVQELMPKDHPDEFLHALMDYSSLALTRPKQKRSISKPFKLSNRFIRGILIKRLAYHPYRTQKLINEILVDTKRTKEDIENALQGLEKEGLVVSKNGNLTLP